MAQIPDGAKLLRVLEGSSIRERGFKRDWAGLGSCGLPKSIWLLLHFAYLQVLRQGASGLVFAGLLAADAPDSVRESGCKLVFWISMP